jgi:hypothetical protein
MWLPDRSGLRFGGYGTVVSSGSFQVDGSLIESPCSLELWIQPAQASASGTILAFYQGQKQFGLSLHQSVSDLKVEEGQPDRPYPATALRMYVDDLFRRRHFVFLTVTTGAHGTSVYVGGVLVRTVEQHRLSAKACTGQLILGDSALQQDTWSGQVNGLAIYDSELIATTVLAHYKTWAEFGQPEVVQSDRCVGLYRFEERAGNIVRNQCRSGLELTIPRVYTVQDQILLEPFWEEFTMSWGYWNNALKNIIGFVPLGFCFYGYLSLARRPNHPVLVTVLCGAAVSLTIEVLQGFLPTRQSGTTDLITNTVGTYVGVLSNQTMGPLFCHRFRANEVRL